MKKVVVILALAALLVLAGCTGDKGPKVDGSSEAAFEESFETLVESLDESQKDKVEQGLQRLSIKIVHDMSREDGRGDDFDFFTMMTVSQLPGADREYYSRLLAELDGASAKTLTAIADDGDYAQYQDIVDMMPPML